MSQYQVLTDEQVQSFLDNGYLKIENCFSREFAQRWTDRAFERLGYDKHDPATWERPLVHMDIESKRPVSEMAPRAWDAICDVVGGVERIDPETRHIESRHFTTINSFYWGDSFVANFGKGADEPWQPPSPQVPGWHKDGSYFRHFLDSPQQALLVIVLWSDVVHQGGGTFIAPDSVRHVARHLYAHPEGVRGFSDLIHQCERFEEVTGSVGDVFIMHPFMLHASSQNHAGVARFITNPPVMLREPLNFNRENADDFSLLERATLHYLGLERLDFQPTAEREIDFIQG